MQGYPPLIDLNSNLVFEQVSYDGAVLDLLRVKKFDPKYALTMEYKFDSEGKVIATHGYLRVWSRWVAEATIYPAARGVARKQDVKFYRSAGRNEIPDPDDAEYYVGAFESAPVYSRFDQMPCWELLKEAEKKSATQK